MRQIVKVSVGLLLVAVLVGCGAGRSKSGVVSGKVTYKSQPLKGAALLLHAAGNPDDPPITIPVDDDGTYRIADVPKGEYKIVVQGTEGSSQVSAAHLKSMPPEKQAEVKAMLAKMNTAATIPFPKKYKDLKTTDLKCNVTERSETIDLELKD